MMKQRRGLLFGGALLLAAASCVTVNIYFPAPAVRDAAEQIAEDTWGEGAEVAPQALGSTSRALDATASLLALIGPRDAFAADADINVSTAAIRAIKDAMAERAATMRPWLEGGQIGVDAQGALAVRDFSSFALPDQAKARRLIDAENRDRTLLYGEIAAANDFGKDRVPEIQKIFATTWNDQARRSGWWTKSASGSWQAP